MPLRPANSPLSPNQSRALDWYLASTGLGCNPALGRAAREAEYARLDALPDGALRSMGLSRRCLPLFTAIYSIQMPYDRSSPAAQPAERVA